MPSDFVNNTDVEAAWLAVHPLRQEDSAAVAALRSAVAPMKGKIEGTAGRDPFNGVMEGVAVPEGVTFEAASVGGISGWWAKPRHETSLASSRRMLASTFSSQITGSRLSTRFPPPSAIFRRATRD